MDRMKTLFMYGVWIVAFFIYSNIAIDIFIEKSYQNVPKQDIQIEQSDDGFELTVERANSNKLQGYFTGTVKNTSNHVIEKKYVKVESFYKGKKMQEKYLAFENLQPGEVRHFKLKYKVGQIDQFKVSYVDEIPMNRTIIDDGIDLLIKFVGDMKNNKILGDVKDKVSSKDGAYGLPGFEPVHVEGNDLALFTAVMVVLWNIPSGAIWFIL